MWAYVTIAIGGIFGCWARYAMTNSVQGLLGRAFPYATLSINVLACLLIGFLFTAMWSGRRRAGDPARHPDRLSWRLFDLFDLRDGNISARRTGRMGRSALYVFLSLLLGLVATFVGVFAARAI